MKAYIVSLVAGEKGEHMVHDRDCGHVPEREHQGALGLHSKCEHAIKEAARIRDNWKYNGCSFCCPECHKA